MIRSAVSAMFLPEELASELKSEALKGYKEALKKYRTREGNVRPRITSPPMATLDAVAMKRYDPANHSVKEFWCYLIEPTLEVFNNMVSATFKLIPCSQDQFEAFEDLLFGEGFPEYSIANVAEDGQPEDLVPFMTLKVELREDELGSYKTETTGFILNEIEDTYAVADFIEWTFKNGATLAEPCHKEIPEWVFTLLNKMRELE